MTYRVYISQTIVGKSNYEIAEEYEFKLHLLEEIRVGLLNLGIDLEVQESLNLEGLRNEATILACMSDSFRLIKSSDIAVFTKDWYKYTDCRLEYQFAKECGVSILLLK